jgi:hypothetical protein
MKKTKTFLSLVLTITTSVSLYSCGHSAEKTNTSNTNDTSQHLAESITDLKEAPENDIYLVNVYTGRLNSYNTKEHCYAEVVDSNNNYYCYMSPCAQNVYTVGDSNYYGFNVFSLNGDKIDITYSAKGNEGIFPLASTDDEQFFICSDYDENNELVTSHITELDKNSNKMKEFKNISGMITNGTVVGNTLYYTQYNEPEDIYTLYSVDKDDISAVPEKIRDLKDGELYTYNNELLYIENGTIRSGDNSFESGMYCFFWNDLFVNFKVDDEGDLSANVFDAKTGSEMDSYCNPVGFRSSDDGTELYLCCLGDMHTYTA